MHDPVSLLVGVVVDGGAAAEDAGTNVGRTNPDSGPPVHSSAGCLAAEFGLVEYTAPGARPCFAAVCNGSAETQIGRATTPIRCCYIDVPMIRVRSLQYAAANR